MLLVSAAGVLLIFSGLSKVRADQRARFQELLYQHHLLPPRLQKVVGSFLPLIELLLGLSVLLLVGTDAGRWVTGIAATLYGFLLLYLVALYRGQRGISCGCLSVSASEEPPNAFHILRAIIFFMFALTGAVNEARLPDISIRLLVFNSSVVAAILLSVLPTFVGVEKRLTQFLQGSEGST
ncbi:MAG: MauE/DoxX family redox-associated membrane protein [Actinomycetota bacterium]